MRVCYLDCHGSVIVLLPSDKHRKYITSITAVLLPFLMYLLTLPCTKAYEVTNPEQAYGYTTFMIFEFVKNRTYYLTESGLRI
jgi:hypothetical protein